MLNHAKQLVRLEQGAGMLNHAKQLVRLEQGAGMLKYTGQFVQRQPLLLSCLKINRQGWRHRQGLRCEVALPDTLARVGEFEYVPHTGGVTGIYLERDFRGKLLEQQVLVYMMRDMLDSGADSIWRAMPREKDILGPAFYSRLWDFEYKAQDLHPTVMGGGYTMAIPGDPRSLLVKPGIGMY